MKNFILFAIFSMTLFTACKKEEEVKLTPERITGPAETSYLGYQQTYLGESLYARLTTGEGEPVPEEEVSFTLVSGNADIITPNPLTDVNGTAFTDVFLNEPGTVIIQAGAEGLSQKLTYTIEVGEGYASRIGKVSADSASRVKSAQEPVALTVRVTNDFDHPSEGVGVQFRLLSGAGDFQEATLIETDENGMATAYFTPGPEEAVHHLEARVSDNVSVEFHAFTLYPTVITADTTKADGHYITWEKSINPFFRTYKVYRATTDFQFSSSDYELIAEIEDIDSLSLVDPAPKTGGYYAYRVDIETRPGEEVEGTSRGVRHSWHMEYSNRYRGLSQVRNQLYLKEGNKINVYDLFTLHQIETFEVHNFAQSVCLSYDEQMLYVGNSDGEVITYDAVTGQAVDTLYIGDVLLSDIVNKIYHAGPDKLIAYNTAYRRYILVDMTGTEPARRTDLSEIRQMANVQPRLEEELIGNGVYIDELGYVRSTEDGSQIGKILHGAKSFSADQTLIYNADLYGLTVYDAATLTKQGSIEWSLGTPYVVEPFDNDRYILIQTTDHSDNYQNPNKTFVIRNPWVE